MLFDCCVWKLFLSAAKYNKVKQLISLSSKIFSSLTFQGFHHLSQPMVSECLQVSIFRTKSGPLSACSKANLLTVGCDEGKCSIYCRVPCKESRQLALKVLKVRMKGVWSAHGHSSDWWWRHWTEVIKRQYHQVSRSNSVGSTCLW